MCVLYRTKWPILRHSAAATENGFAWKPMRQILNRILARITFGLATANGQRNSLGVEKLAISREKTPSGKTTACASRLVAQTRAG